MAHVISRFARILAEISRDGVRTIFAALILASGAAWADNDSSDAPRFSLHGFGTLGAVHSDQNYSDVVSNTILQPNGAGHTNAWSTAVDSKIGGQLDMIFNPRLSAVVQIVSQHRYDNSWAPDIEWANVKYQVAPGLDVRVGRTVLPIFMMSDTTNVGYANPWLRGPQEIYSMVPITHMDGIDLAWSANIGSAENRFQASFGTDQFHSTLGKISGHAGWVLSDTIEYEALALRVAYTSVDITFDSSDLEHLINGISGLGGALSNSGFPMEGEVASSLANRYDVHDTPLQSFTAGARFHPGNWLLMGEWVRMPDSAILAEAHAWYIMGGYRFDKLTPYVTVAEINSKTPSEPGIPLAGLPPGLQGAAGALNAGLNAVLFSTAPSQKSLTLGLRWDLLDNAALKFEYEHVRLDNLSAGRFGNLQPGFRPGGDADLFSIALDFVF